jgi:hypothetical protein
MMERGDFFTIIVLVLTHLIIGKFFLDNLIKFTQRFCFLYSSTNAIDDVIVGFSTQIWNL